MFVKWMLLLAVISLCLPLIQIVRDRPLSEKLLVFASFSSKAAVLTLAIAVTRQDWMLAVAAVIALSIGNAGIMLLAQLFNRMEVE